MLGSFCEGTDDSGSILGATDFWKPWVLTLAHGPWQGSFRGFCEVQPSGSKYVINSGAGLKKGLLETHVYHVLSTIYHIYSISCTMYHTGFGIYHILYIIYHVPYYGNLLFWKLPFCCRALWSQAPVECRHIALQLAAAIELLWVVVTFGQRLLCNSLFGYVLFLG